MIRDDDDVQAKLTSTDGFWPRAEGSVTAFAVRAHGALRSYVWFGDDPHEHAAGVVSIPAAGADAMNEAAAFSQRLRDAAKEGASPRDAVLNLRDAEGSAGGVVDPTPLPFEHLSELRGQVRSAQTPVPRVPDAREIDAVLLGAQRSTPEVDAAIERLDSALRVRPTPEPLTVWLPLPTGVEPGSLEPGSSVTQPTFLRTRFKTDETDFGDAPSVLVLDVAAGVPAMWVESRGTGTLLLARDLTWVVRTVEQDGHRTVVRGASTT